MAVILELAVIENLFAHLHLQDCYCATAHPVRRTLDKGWYVAPPTGGDACCARLALWN